MIQLRSKWITLLLEPKEGGRLLKFSDKVAKRNLLGVKGCVEHAFSPVTQVVSFARSEAKELSDFPSGCYLARVDQSQGYHRASLSRQGWVRLNGVRRPVKMTKTVTLLTRGRKVLFTQQLQNPSARSISFLFASELNLNLKDAHVNRTGEAPGVQRFAVVDPAARLQVSWAFSRPARLWHFPLEKGSGANRVFEGMSLTSVWPVQICPRGSWQVRWEVAVGAPDV